MRLHGLLGSNELRLGQNAVMLATYGLLILVRSGFASPLILLPRCRRRSRASTRRRRRVAHSRQAMRLNTLLEANMHTQRRGLKSFWGFDLTHPGVSRHLLRGLTCIRCRRPAALDKLVAPPIASSPALESRHRGRRGCRRRRGRRRSIRGRGHRRLPPTAVHQRVIFDQGRGGGYKG